MLADRAEDVEFVGAALCDPPSLVGECDGVDIHVLDVDELESHRE